MGRDGAVGIATRYGPNGPGIHPAGVRDFPHPSRPALGPTQHSLHTKYRVILGGKAAGAWLWLGTLI